MDPLGIVLSQIRQRNTNNVLFYLRVESKKAGLLEMERMVVVRVFGLGKLGDVGQTHKLLVIDNQNLRT